MDRCKPYNKVLRLVGKYSSYFVRCELNPLAALISLHLPKILDVLAHELLHTWLWIRVSRIVRMSLLV